MKISALPLEALLAKLRAGFNVNLEAVATSEYGVKPFRIDFPVTLYSPSTPSFIFGQIPPEDITDFGATNANKVTMFIPQAANQNFEKPRDFSGLVTVGLDFHLEWLSSDMKQNLEAVSLAVEDAFAETVQIATIQNWGVGVVYNGAFSCTRGAIAVPEKGQGSFRQLVAFRLSFQIDV
jgi:hypothetical protein